MATKQPQDSSNPDLILDPSQYLPPRHEGFRLIRKIALYHLSVAIFILGVLLVFPDFVRQMPIGGVDELASSGELSVSQLEDEPLPDGDILIVETFIKATSELDRLGYARQLIIVLTGVWLLMLPVSWVHKGIHRVSAHDHSLDETTLILPGIVAAIVLVVQHSLALAFSLAGIVAGVQFRRALQDTFDALFILVAIGTGIAAGVKAQEIAAVLTLCHALCLLQRGWSGITPRSTQKSAEGAEEGSFLARSKPVNHHPESSSEPGSDHISSTGVLLILGVLGKCALTPLGGRSGLNRKGGYENER